MPALNDVGSSSMEKEHIDINDLHWKEDGPDTPSTVDDSWPSGHKCGKSAKLIAFAHEEFPLERPPINCRLLYDTVPLSITSPSVVDDQHAEKNEPMLDFSCRMILSALNFPPSPRRQSYETNRSRSSRSKSSQHDADDQHEDVLCSPKTNRFRSHTITPLPTSLPSVPPNSIKTVKGVDNLQQCSPLTIHSSGAPSFQEMVSQVPSTSALQTHSILPTLEDHHTRASFVESYIASSPSSEDQGSYSPSSSSRNKHVLSSFTSWWSSSGSRVVPNGVAIANVNLPHPKHHMLECRNPKTLSMRPEISQDNLLSTPSITPSSTPSSSPNASDNHLQGKCFDDTHPCVDSPPDWLSQSRSRDSDKSERRSTTPNPHPNLPTLHSVNPSRSQSTSPSPVAFAVPRVISTTMVQMGCDDNLANTAATMHAVRAWSSPPRQHSTTSALVNGGPPSPLLTVPVRVVRVIRASSSTNQS